MEVDEATRLLADQKASMEKAAAAGGPRKKARARAPRGKAAR
jgi:hypothetical protein